MGHYPLQTAITPGVTPGLDLDAKVAHAKLNGFVDAAADFDLDPTGAVDVGTGLNDAMAVAAGAKVPLRATGTFKSSQVFTVIADVDMAYCTINYTGAGVAVRVAIAGTELGNGRVLTLPRVTRPAELWARNAPSTDVGVSIRYSLGNKIFVPSVQRFTDGILFDPQTGDSQADNTIFVGSVTDCMRKIRVTPGGTGYANHNVVIGGNLEQDGSHGRRVPGTRGIVIEASTNAVNGWHFYNVELQGKGYEATIECAGQACTWVNPEMEQGGDTTLAGATISGGTTIDLGAANVAAGNGFNPTVDGGRKITSASLPAGTTLVAGGFGAPNAEGYAQTATLSQAGTNGSGVTVTLVEEPIVMWKANGGTFAQQNSIQRPSGISTMSITQIRDGAVDYRANSIEAWGNGMTIGRRGAYDTYGTAGLQDYSGGTPGYGSGSPQRGVYLDPVKDLPSGTTPVEASMGVGILDGTHNRRIKLFMDETAGVGGILATYSTGVPKFVIALGLTEHFSIDPTNGVIKIGVAGQKLGLFGTGGNVRQIISGSRSGSTVLVLTQLLAALGSASGIGAIVDSTSA